MKLLVCGGRDFTDAEGLGEWLRWFHMRRPITCLISGAAPGADTLAKKWAELNGIPVMLFPANWDFHRKAAGPIRNANMLLFGEPQGVVAFPGGTGTADMVSKSRAAGVPVLELEATEYGYLIKKPQPNQSEAA